DVVGGGHVRPLLRSSTPEVRRIVEDVIKGDAYIAIAVTERGAGSDMRAMASRAEKVRGGYLLSGEKMFNARFETASHVILFTRSPTQFGGTTRLDAFVVPKDHPGLSYRTIRAEGLRGN